MKYPFCKLSLIVLLIGLSTFRSTAAMELVLATDDTPGPPYIIGSGTTFDPQKPGIEIELYRLVAGKLGFDITFKRFAWANCLELLESGYVDGIFPASFEQERMKAGVYPMKNGQVDSRRKTRDNAYYLYKMKAAPLSWDGNRITNLNGSIGVPLGWAIAGDLRAWGVTVSDIRQPASSMDMLLHERFAGLALLGTVGDAYLKEKPEAYKSIVRLSPPLKSKAYYLMLSHQFVGRQPEMAEKIWDTIAAVLKSAEYRKITTRY